MIIFGPWFFTRTVTRKDVLFNMEVEAQRAIHHIRLCAPPEEQKYLIGEVIDKLNAVKEEKK